MLHFLIIFFLPRKRRKFIRQNIEFRQSQNKPIEIRSVCARASLNWRHRARCYTRNRQEKNIQNNDWRRMFIYGKLFRAHFSLDARVQFHFLSNAQRCSHSHSTFMVQRNSRFSSIAMFSHPKLPTEQLIFVAFTHVTCPPNTSKHSINKPPHAAVYLCSGCFRAQVEFTSFARSIRSARLFRIRFFASVGQFFPHKMVRRETVESTHAIRFVATAKTTLIFLIFSLTQ